MTRKSENQRRSGYTILLVDDNPEYLRSTRKLLKHEGHVVVCAANGPKALTLLRQKPFDLVVVAYSMSGTTGEQVVMQLRQVNPDVQVILQTDQSVSQPPRELIARLDIQGYCDKSEGPEKLLVWIDIGLKAAFTVQRLNKSRQGLRHILDVTPDLHKIQPMQDLLQWILSQVAGLLGAVNSFLALLPKDGASQSIPFESEGSQAVIGEGPVLAIRASTGSFIGQTSIGRLLDHEKLRLIQESIQQSGIRVDETTTVVPLRIGEMTIGIIYLDRPAIRKEDVELLSIFANQAAVAIQNIQLYEMATLDPLTGVYARGFFDTWLIRELRTAFRARQPIGLMLLDMDGLKRINDSVGHVEGDAALITLTQVLRQATRSGDIVGRRGGDEFAIILPLTPLDGAERVGERILKSLRGKYVSAPDGQIPIYCSIGVAIIETHSIAPTALPRPIPPTYFQAMSDLLIQMADDALYQAKKLGGNQLNRGATLEWPMVESKGEVLE